MEDQENDEQNEGNQLCETIAIVIAFAIVCGICVLTTGFCVYTDYGWNGSGSQGPNATFFTKLAGIIEYLGSKIIDKDDDTDSTESKCPEFGPCPSIFQKCWGGGCLAQEAQCISTTTPAPRICENPPTCPPGQKEEPAPCVAPRPQVRTEFSSAIGLFKGVNRKEMPLWRWIQIFAPMSSERLEVITTLMDEDLERWNLASFAIRCSGDVEVELKNQPELSCSFCGKSRYDYILCAMRNNLIGPGDPEKSYYNGEIKSFREQEERIKDMERKLFVGPESGEANGLLHDPKPIYRDSSPSSFWGFDDAMMQMRKLRYKYAVMVRGYNSSAGDKKDEWSCQVCNEHAVEKEGLAYVNCFAEVFGGNKERYEKYVNQLSESA